MAIIGSIRKRGTLIVVIVGLSLGAFILGGAQNLFTGGSDTVGSFNGQKVSLPKYSMMYENKKSFVQIVNPKAEINEETEDALKDEVWEDLLRTMVYEKQYRMLGLALTDAEKNDLFVGETADNRIKEQFVNQQTGKFDPNLYTKQMAMYEDQGQRQGEELQQWIAGHEYWTYYQNVIKNERYSNKYMNMVTNGLYVTSKEASGMYKDNTDRANIRFVVKSYSTIADSTIKYTEDELVNFFKEQKYRMRSKKSKSIKYAVFLSIPTSADTMALKTNIIQLREDLAKADDDTLFVAQNSELSDELPSAPIWVKKAMINVELDSLLFNAANGTVAGPVMENGYYIVAKKVTERFQPDSCKARHILIQPTENSEAAVKVALDLRDSLFIAIQNGANFAELAIKFSKDGSAKDSGNLGWFAKGAMVAEFNDSCFISKKGDFKKVNSQFGFHIVNILDQTPLVKEDLIAMIIKPIKPSEGTKKVQYDMANDLAYNKGVDKNFDGPKYMEDFAKKRNLIYREEASITESSKNILNMPNTKQVVKWALGAKRGDISDIFESGDNYIVAVVTSNRPEGIPALNDVRDEVIAAFRKHKKAEQFINEFNSALALNKDLNALSASLKLNIGTANDISFGSYFVPGAGIEPVLMGTAFGLKIGQISKPIEGNSGVFVAVVDQFNPAPEMKDFTQMKRDISNSYTKSRAADVINAIKEKANVKDYRYKFDVF